MTDFLKKLASLALPSWMNKGEPLALLKTARMFWAEVYGWITWPLRQFEPLTCIEPVLNLIAYDRDITRFSGEPLTVCRKTRTERVEMNFSVFQFHGCAKGLRKKFMFLILMNMFRFL